MADVKTRTGIRRTLGVYIGLVVVPVVVAIVLLGSGEDGDNVAKAKAAAGPSLVQLLLAITVIVGACKIVGWLGQRVGQPAVMGEIVAGIVLGPSVLGALWPQGAAVLLPKAAIPQLNVVAQLGVIFFVFLAGLELNTRLLRGRGRLAVVVSHVSIAFPFLLGVGLAVFAYSRFAPEGVGFLAFALFFGVSLSITALPVLVRILHEIGLFRTEAGVVALTCAVVDDVTAWSLLALVVALTTASSLFGVVLTVALTVAFVAFLGLVVRPLLRKLVTRVPVARLQKAAPLSVVGVLLCALATEWIGVHAMFGAFVFGLVFPRDNVVATWLMDKVGGLTTALMLPLFFAYSGLRTNITLISAEGWLWCAVILVAAVVGKLGGSALSARAVGENWNRALQVGVLMNCRGLTELVVLNIGLDLGVLSPMLFTMLVIMALVSTAMAGPMATWFARRDGQNVVGLPPRTSERAAA